jgi:hypothetical protein
MPKID